jgi:hypothetical protein
MLGSQAGLIDRAAADVAREPERAHVTVAQAGFTRGASTGGDVAISYGLELVNDSYEFDAIDVAVRWRLAGADGRALAGDAIALTAVPASTTFYVGGQTRVAAGAAVGRVSTSVTYRVSRKRGIFLPVAADIRLRTRGSDRVRLTGKLTNAFATRLSEQAAIYAVVFDSEGRIIGGAAERIAPATRGLPPGDTTGFTIDVPAPTGSRHALFAGVSIDP